MTEQQPAGDAQSTDASGQQTGAPEQVQSGGVVVKVNPELRAAHGVVIPGVGHFVGGERISKSQFNDLEKNATARRTGSDERYPLLVKEEE